MALLIYALVVPIVAGIAILLIDRSKVDNDVNQIAVAAVCFVVAFALFGLLLAQHTGMF